MRPDVEELLEVMHPHMTAWITLLPYMFVPFMPRLVLSLFLAVFSTRFLYMIVQEEEPESYSSTPTVSECSSSSDDEYD